MHTIAPLSSVCQRPGKDGNRPPASKATAFRRLQHVRVRAALLTVIPTFSGAEALFRSEQLVFIRESH
jgi:hypothetical protein